MKEILQDDLPAYINKIKEIKGDVPQHWIGHSWGGIMILAYLAKNFGSVKIASMVFFGTKRFLTVMNLKKIWTINFLWGTLARLGIAIRGYLPAKEYEFGSDNETRTTFYENNIWLKSKKWLDPKDKFDYAAALKKVKLPPTLYLTGKSDDILGDEPDVKFLMEETGKQNNYFMKLSKEAGNMHDYGHNDILSHKDAVSDVYPIVLDFMQQYPG